MTFKKGNPGNPNGSRRPRIVTQHIIAALNEATEEGPTRLRALVNALIATAIDGNVQAIKEIIDRVEGKAPQETALHVDDKRDVREWTNAELNSFLNDCRAQLDGAAEPDGGGGEPEGVQ